MTDPQSKDLITVMVEISEAEFDALDRHIRRIRGWVDKRDQAPRAAHHLFTATAREQVNFVASAFALMEFIQDSVIKL